MAHFAELDDNNIVIRTIVVNNEVLLDENGIEVEQIGSDFCAELFGGRWKQFSINTNNNTHFLGGTPFRANAAMPGMYFDEEKNAFYWKDFPSPYPSWILSAGYVWEAPTPYPSGDGIYEWIEDDLNWQLVEGV